MADGEARFGTSGVRGPATALAGDLARRYAAALIVHLRRSGQLAGARQVFIGQDARPSSAGIAGDCADGVRAMGMEPIDCGRLPTPALALHALAHGAPAIMVTGSHIPADRNGLKFYSPCGEIGKADEAGVTAALAEVAAPATGKPQPPAFAPDAAQRYRERYWNLLPNDALAGWRVGVFEHSTVSSDILCELLQRYGADVVRLGRADGFVAVDTEAFGDPVLSPLGRWVDKHGLDAVVSADADGDRPLVVDGEGSFLRGDVLGTLAAQFVGADAVVTPITSNSAIERAFGKVVRTKVGSPFVIAGMDRAHEEATEGGVIAGFEANGGVLLGTSATVNGVPVSALPTRDAVLPVLATLAMAARADVSLAELVRSLSMRAAAADRLQEIASTTANDFVSRLIADTAFAQDFFRPVGEVSSVDGLDGARVALRSGDVVHFRASGNAPELRCYVEADAADRAGRLIAFGMAAARDHMRGQGRTT